MTDETQETVPVANFVCGYCQRRFTKKEHLKPFKCAICQRSFSRGDVLSRHVKGHKQAAQLQAISASSPAYPSSLNPFQSPGGSSSRSTSAVPGSGPDPILVAGNDGTSIHRVSNIGHITWPSATRPEARFAEPDMSSSLLWPDSEDLFQSLMAADGMSWDQSMASLIPAPELPHQPGPVSSRASVGTPGDDELAAAEDGHRAVQTINGLLTNTLFNVTSHVELSDLTPRFLDSSLHMFFTKFVPILPVIHRPTFVYRDCSAPLLLNAIALGSLFLGTEDATVKGEALWRLAYTAIATSWSEMIGHKREHDGCSGVELVLTALLSQIYAALSKDRTLRMTSQTFYGLSMHWAQYCGMYDMNPCRPDVALIPRTHDPEETKQNAWRSWAARETQLRTLLGLCIIDGVVSQFSGNLVNTWPATNSLPLAADEDVFAADTVDRWIEAMIARGKSTIVAPPERFSDLYHSLLAGGTPPPDRAYGLPGLLNIKILLEMLASLTTDFERTSRGQAGAVQSKLGAVRALCSLRRHLARSGGLNAADRAVGLLRWHAVCLDLVVSTARGARRMCYHYGITQHIFGGSKRQEPTRIDPEGWTRGLRARKCLLHALEIHKLASEVPLGVVHDTSLPGALFAAATTYCSFALPGVSKILVPPMVDWEKVILCELDEESDASPLSDEGRDTLAFLQNDADYPAVGWVARNLVYEMSSTRILLHSLSQHWGVTQEMEEVVGAWEVRCS
ncbi:C2H2 type zinc finger domain protein [Colletotrichum plurivorum]|uniref:C2H2 type zinc finger domain protein n=1 Tax=Colletotrichum plurivorum TaxID=2175906 RepID=A0A8H6N1Z1_9PEZI|nr:C2H2 type zinc finger domain protein [Colletotrichum plurivorum]